MATGIATDLQVFYILRFQEVFEYEQICVCCESELWNIFPGFLLIESLDKLKDNKSNIEIRCFVMFLFNVGVAMAELWSRLGV